jgi:membrane protein
MEFLLKWVSVAKVQWTRGDPLLMGAAIAYNSLFALVPLGIAFVSIVTLLDSSNGLTSRVVDLINSALPSDIADFLLEILQGSTAVVGEDQTVVLVISIAVALWSGSRAVYAVQKSLRLVQGVPEDRGYLRARFTGIAVTLGAGVSVMVGYAVLLFGESLWDEIGQQLGLTTVGLAQVFLSVLLALWVFGLLWVVYRFGPPIPVKHSVVVAAVVEIVLVLGSWVAFDLLPSDTTSVLAAFGVLGLVLVLLYFVGVTVVAAPIIVGSGWDALTDTYQRYAQGDDRDAIQAEGPQEGDVTAGEAPQ